MGTTVIDRRAYPAGLRQWDWRARDGWLHRRVDWPQPDGIAPRGSLLFAGGRGDFVEKYLEALGDWHARGWSVSSFDWRGQGRSKGSNSAGHFDSFDILVEDLGDIIDDWASSTPGPHVVVAHSMGAHMLLRLLVERRTDIAAAVLVAPMIAVNSGVFPEWATAGLAATATMSGFGRWPIWGVQLARAPVGSARQRILTGDADRYEDELYWWDREPDATPVAPSFGWLNAAYHSARAFTAEALAKVEVPVLLLGADKDQLVSPSAIKRVAGLLPKGELVMYDDCAHEILRERDHVRGDALARIDAFLDKQAR
ncbi:MAG: alpha/beta hydrolase [Alphaproteobacteria bacterium]|jgi:lysophospholipase|nr:alpha/beta hydrolase [Alphaproteobacteria bacterium]